MAIRKSRLWLGAVVCVSWVVLGLGASRARAAQGQVLRILTFNFNSEVVAFDDRDSLMRDIRFSALAELIESTQPDLVLIQEGWNYRGFPSVAIPLARATRYDYYYRLTVGFPGLIYDSDNILARPDLHLGDTRKITLPHSAVHLGDQIHTVIPFGKISLALGSRAILYDGTPLYVYTTHLIGDTEKDRTDQVKRLDAEIRKHAAADGVDWSHANVIVTGDLNSAASSAPIQYLTQNGYRDTFAEAHPDHLSDGAGATDCPDPWSPNFNPVQLGAGQFPGQDSPNPNERIDYVFARGPRVKVLASTVVFTRPVGGFWMSDHYGVLTTLAVNSDAPPRVDNPVTDSDGAPVPPSRIVEITDKNFDPCDDVVDCDLQLPDQTVDGARGITVVNRSSDEIHAKITGPGHVLPKSSTKLGGGHASAFVLVKPGDYRLHINNRWGDELRALIHVR